MAVSGFVPRNDITGTPDYAAAGMTGPAYSSGGASAPVSSTSPTTPEAVAALNASREAAYNNKQDVYAGYNKNLATFTAANPQYAASSPVGTMNAQITTPTALTKTVQPPAVVTSDAATKDLASKQAQVDQLKTDTANHQAIVNTPIQPPADTTKKTSDPTETQPSSLDEQLSSLLSGLNTADSTIDKNAQAQVSPLQQQQQALQTQLDTDAASALTKLNSIASGTYPLSPAEGDLLSSTRAMYMATISAQTTANSAFEGQTAEIMASLGISTSAPTQAVGLMHAVISSGNEKVANLNAQMSKSLSDLQIGFQQSDYKMISDAWDKTSSYMTDRIKTLQAMQTQVMDAAKQQKQDNKDYTTLALNYVMQSANFSQKEKEDAVDTAYKQGMLSENKRHDMATEAVAWTNANKHTYQLTDNGVIFDTNTGQTFATPTGVAPGGASTKSVDGSDINQTIANIAHSNKLGATTQASINPILGVINAAKTMAENNPGAKFGGINPLNVINDAHIPFTSVGLPFRQAGMSSAGVQNRESINGINLKVQQWASGASLTTAQTKQVEAMVPTPTDTDTKVAEKLNNLTNFMNDQIKSALATNGVVYNPVKVNLFDSTNTNNQQKSLDDIFKAPSS